MNTSKFAACPSCGANATDARTNINPATHAAALAVPAPGLQREHQRREHDGEGRDDAHGPQRAGAEDAERRRVEVGNEWRLAVRSVLVEPATFVDDLGLRREEGLVRVEDLDEEPRQPQCDRQEQ